MRQSVAFLALKQLDAYSYNNSAFTELYQLQGEDQTSKHIAGSWSVRIPIRR